MKPKTKFILFLLFSYLPLCIVFGQDAELLNFTTGIIVRNNVLIKEYLYEIRINNANGEKHTSVTLPYNKLHKISNINAKITDNSGKIVSKLKPSDIKKRSLISDDAFFMDAMVLEFSLHHFSFPYIFNYSYKEESSQFLYIDNWLPFISPFVGTKNAELSLSVPKNYGISIKNFRIENPVVNESENIIVYKWKTTFKALSKPEELMPDYDELIPTVSIVPKKFRYQTTGSFESWKSYGQWQYNTNEKLMTLNQSDINEIQALIQNVPDTIEKIKILYHRLQDQTRYVNISLKTGGMIPEDGKLVSETKYGDCKGLTNYFSSVLQSVGIKSIYVTVNAGTSAKTIDETFPSQQFNHVILCVPLKADTLWLDCTSKGPFGYLGSFTQNRAVLLIENNHSAIKHTPALGIQEVRTDRKFVIQNDSDGINRISSKCTYRGENFERLLQISKLSDFKQNIIAGQYFGLQNTEVENYKITPKHRDDREISFEFTAKSKKYIQKAGTEILIRPVPFEMPQFGKPALRKYPVKFDFPVSISDIQTVEINFDLSTFDTIPDIKIETPFGSYNKIVKFSKNSITITKSLTLKAGFYTQEEYPSFYIFIEKIKENESNVLVFNTIK